MATTIWSSTSSKGDKTFLTYAVTSTETTVTITCSSGTKADTKALTSVNGLLSISSTSAMVSSMAKGQTKTFFSNVKKTYNRGTSASTQTITASTRLGMSSSNSSSVSYNLTVPALTSHKITYNANGGSGAPSQQTKYYGKNITLSTTIPTRTGYKFLGWSKNSATGGVTYKAGASYTVNSTTNITLYAVWQLNVVLPKIFNLIATRAEEIEEGVYVDSDIGTVPHVKFNWYVGTTESGGSIIPGTLKIGIKPSTSSTFTYGSETLTDDYVNVYITNYTLQEAVKYDIRVVLESTGYPNSSKDTYITTTFFAIDLNATGTAIGFGQTAPDNDEGYFFASNVHAPNIGAVNNAVRVNAAISSANIDKYDTGATISLPENGVYLLIGTWSFQGTDDSGARAVEVRLVNSDDSVIANDARTRLILGGHSFSIVQVQTVANLTAGTYKIQGSCNVAISTGGWTYLRAVRIA